MKNDPTHAMRGSFFSGMEMRTAPPPSPAPTTWLAGRIYRTGILMYGKKTNYKELWKWLRYQ